VPGAAEDHAASLAQCLAAGWTSVNSSCRLSSTTGRTSAWVAVDGPGDRAAVRDAQRLPHGPWNRWPQETAERGITPLRIPVSELARCLAPGLPCSTGHPDPCVLLLRPESEGLPDPRPTVAILGRVPLLAWILAIAVPMPGLLHMRASAAHSPISGRELPAEAGISCRQRPAKAQRHSPFRIRPRRTPCAACVADASTTSRETACGSHSLPPAPADPSRRSTDSHACARRHADRAR